uniref:Uncharacterized protein n=1 Tax=viral metagenome TaxID=1070528 RepID=A0A6H1Z7K4_9ZZZZ
MTTTPKKYTPDASGTVVVKGFEDKAEKLKLDLTYFKKLKTDTEEGKEEFRGLAADILRSSGPGAARVLFRSAKNGDGIKCSRPDPVKEGNRPDFSEATLKELTAAGGLDAVRGLVDPPVVEEREQVTLSGQWADWFLTQIKVFVEAGQVNSEQIDEAYAAGEIKLDKKARLRPDAGQILQQLLTDCSEEQAELIAVLLRKGFKAMSVS